MLTGIEQDSAFSPQGDRLSSLCNLVIYSQMSAGAWDQNEGCHSLKPTLVPGCCLLSP